MRPATDDWPFLYLRDPMVPDLSLRGVAIMGGLAAVLFGLFWRGSVGAGRWRLDGRMFFLGAGFMLVETKAVVNMALLFGSTWMVNTIVFAGVLVMVLGANLFVSRVRPVGLGPYYAGLMVVLALNVFVPLDAFLGLSRVAQVTAAACVLAFTPIPVLRRDLRGSASAAARGPIRISARTSRAPCSAAWPRTRRCCSVSGTSRSWSLASTRFQGSSVT